MGQMRAIVTFCHWTLKYLLLQTLTPPYPSPYSQFLESHRLLPRSLYYFFKKLRNLLHQLVKVFSVLSSMLEATFFLFTFSALYPMVTKHTEGSSLLDTTAYQWYMQAASVLSINLEVLLKASLMLLALLVIWSTSTRSSSVVHLRFLVMLFFFYETSCTASGNRTHNLHLERVTSWPITLLQHSGYQHISGKKFLSC